MPTLFAQRFADIARPVLETRLGELVALSRGSTLPTTGVTAIVAEHKAEVQTAGPGGLVVTQLVDRVWTIVKAVYLIGGVAVTPLPGDRITDAGGVIWEVMRGGTESAVVSYAGDLEWSVNTKRISA